MRGLCPCRAFANQARGSLGLTCWIRAFLKRIVMTLRLSWSYLCAPYFKEGRVQYGVGATELPKDRQIHSRAGRLRSVVCSRKPVNAMDMREVQRSVDQSCQPVYRS